MCGICGIYYRSPDRSPPWDEKVIKKMTISLRHRGPDDMGVYSEGPIALGTARLAIIDLSSLARQPMVLDGGDHVICFNGEIYNYVELRQDLEMKGIVFGSASDTEVLLRLYIQKGIHCLNDLRGMFAFAVWDRKTKTLFLARDRTGEKPLVYYHRKGIFAFASEIKALLTLPEVPREIDRLGLHYGLHYVNIPAPYSAFKHIRKLRPAEYMIVSPQRLTIDRYWRPKYNPNLLIKNPQEAVYELNHRLDETVKIMCRSDVPLGATLSGGLDSSAIVAALSRESEQVQTFCVSHDIHGDDTEFEAARRVAEKFGNRHHELTFHRSDLATVGEVVRGFSEPIATFVPLHAYALAALIRKHVKVALTGSGGDELFGGYPDHRLYHKLDQRFYMWNQLDQYGLGRMTGLIPLSGIRRSRQKYLDLRSIPINQMAAVLRLRQANKFCGMVYSNNMKSLIRNCNPSDLLVECFDSYGATKVLDGYLIQQLMVISQHGIVDIPDTVGMANSLEYRSPFLDVKMIELAMRIPGSMKVRIRRGESGGKWILRRAMEHRLPKKNVSMNKTGFGAAIPYKTWMLTAWTDYVKKKLNSPALADVDMFQLQQLNDLYDQACSGKPVPLEMLWGVVMIAQWLEELF